MSRVLLVLGFIVAASVPLSQSAGPVAPSHLAAAAPLDIPRDADVVLVYASDRTLTLNHQPVSLDVLSGTLRALYRQRQDRVLWIEGAGSLRYGDVADIIEIAREAGVPRVGVVTPAMKQP